MEIPPIVHIRPPFWWVRWIPAALLIASLIALTIAIGGNVLVPLLVSFALAFMLEPLADWFQRRGRSRSAAVLLTLASAVLLVALLLLFLLPGIYRQLIESIEKLPLALRAVAAWAQHLLGFARERLSPEVFARLQAAVADFENDPSALTSRIGGWLSKGLLGLVSLGSGALGMLIVPFFVYYLLLDMSNLRRVIVEHIPERHRGVARRLLDEVGEVVRGYVRGRFLMALMMAAIYGTGLLILRVPLWAGIGLIAGFIGIIPYLGVISGLILALGFAALDGAGLGRLAGVGAVFAIAQVIEDYILTPRIIGGKLELHPMLVFITLIIAGDLFGLLGLVLAIPVLAVIKVLIRFLDELYLRSDYYLAPAPATPTGETTAAQRAVAATVSTAQAEADAQRVVATREAVPPKEP
jgi:predicted PurR-regulated permease PerM